MTDRIDYFRGATFSTSENVTNFGAWAGASHGNYIFTKIKDEVTGKFRDYVLSNGLYMHEYGHTFDSRAYGPLYLFNVMIPSGWSALRIKPIPDFPDLNTHNIRKFEMDASRRSKKYFGKHYGVNWDIYEPPTNHYPTHWP